MLSARRKIYLTLGVFLAALFALAFFALPPLCSKISRHSQALAEAESTLNALGEQLNIFEQFQTNSIIYQEYILLLDTFFIQQSAPIRFMEFIEKEAALAGLAIDVQALSAGQLNQDEFGFQIKVEGPYPQTLMFLERLEEAPWLIELPKLTVQRYSEDKKRKQEEHQLQEGEVALTVTVKAVPAGASFSEPNKEPAKVQVNF